MRQITLKGLNLPGGRQVLITVGKTHGKNESVIQIKPFHGLDIKA